MRITSFAPHPGCRERVFWGELSSPAELDRAGVSQTYPLQQRRQSGALCGLGTGPTLFRRGSRGLQVTAVTTKELPRGYSDSVKEEVTTGYPAEANLKMRERGVTSYITKTELRHRIDTVVLRRKWRNNKAFNDLRFWRRMERFRFSLTAHPIVNSRRSRSIGPK